jgi:diguanylate cyclase (GGDEF)-like protein
MNLRESVGWHVSTTPIGITAAWLGLEETDLDGVAPWLVEAIARRLSQPDPEADLRSELLDRLQESVSELHHMAHTDQLTRLANRRAVEDRLANEVARARRHQRELAVLLLDVDGLKSVNDEFGHAAGDQLLRVVGRRIKRVVRVTDMAGRWGGDEFVVVCPETDGGAARTLADKLKHAVAGRPVRLPGGSCPVGISVGWAVDGRSGEAGSLLAAADASLYAAKRARVDTRDLRGRAGLAPRRRIHVVDADPSV